MIRTTAKLHTSGRDRHASLNNSGSFLVGLLFTTVWTTELKKIARLRFVKILNKSFLTLFGLLITISSFGQIELNNIKTSEHKLIVGTNIYLIPPPQFNSAKNFKGFQQDESGASINVMEIPGPYSEISMGFDENNLKTQGVILKKKAEIKVNGTQGLFITSEQFAYEILFIKYILVFGDDKTTYLINGVFPKELSELDKDVIKSMYSIVYEKGLTVDPLNTAPFTINTQNTKLKFGASMAGMLMYSVDGRIPTESNDKTALIVGKSLSEATTMDKKATAIAKIKCLPFSNLKIEENKIRIVQIDGMQGYEITSEGINNSDNTLELVYQVMLFTEKSHYLIVGTSNNNFGTNLEIFKKIARTFKRK